MAKFYDILPANANVGEILAGVTAPAYGETLYGLVPGGKFIYCYTALTTLHQGSVVTISTDTGDTAGLNPRAVLPTTTSVYNQYGICAETKAAAGGIWVQVGGRCTHSIVDGTTDVGINDPLKPSNGSHALVNDHADTGTASMVAIAESAETDTLTVQGDATYGGQGASPQTWNTVYLLDRWATVA